MVAKRGFVYTLEVMLAIVIVSVAIASIFLQSPEKPQSDVAVMERLGAETLEFMDSNGTLRSYAAKNDAASIEKTLDELLPRTVDSNVTICSSTCAFSSLPADRTVVVADYYVSGYKDTYIGKKVRLFMWVKKR